MKKIIYLFLMLISTVSWSQSPTKPTCKADEIRTELFAKYPQIKAANDTLNK